jgi:A/G-specific adenine glycosylase
MAEQGPKQKLSVALLNWYDVHARVLPWRARGGLQPDPYKVWLSEIMLQQTTVAAVKDYFIKFVGLWPTVTDLAAADREDVMRAWAGLGYYARARNLHACAKVVTLEMAGRFPQSLEALQQLPGIGPYTAGAIAAIAFDVPAAAVDGNVERVISRLRAIENPLPSSKPEIRAYTQSLVPKQRAGDFAQALMDLGATICTTKSPSCNNCPWAEHCAGRKQGIAETLPRKGYVFWIEGRQGVLLRKRPDKGLLGGMLEVPSTNWQPKLPRNFTTDAPLLAKWKKQPGIVAHTFTHFHLELTVMVAESISTGEMQIDGDYRWVTRENLSVEALPTVMKKVVSKVLG